MSAFEGACPSCGRVYHGVHEDTVVCGCFEICPLCGRRMEPYVPDLSPGTYAKDGKRDLLIVRVCSNHIPPFFSEQKPVEVVLERLV